jgi:hypothetical protein
MKNASSQTDCTLLKSVRTELACHTYYSDFTIARMREWGMGWVHGVVTEYKGSRVTVSDGCESVEVTLHPWVKRVHTSPLATIRAALQTGSVPAVSIKLRYNAYCRSTTVWYYSTQPEADRCAIMLLPRRLKLYAEE